MSLSIEAVATAARLRSDSGKSPSEGEPKVA
jgi:hypothetical protein